MKINLLLLTLSTLLFGQSGIRLSDYLWEKDFMQVRSTYYQAILKLDAADQLMMPGYSITLDGANSGMSLLGYKSVDMIPIDMLNLNNVKREIKPDIFSSKSNFIVNSKSIPDSLEIKARLFFGGETGDPMHHIFTMPEKKFINKNKIIPAGSFSISFGNEKVRNRISGGYYGYFSTGGENDSLINKTNSYYYSKQNKQFLLKNEFLYSINDNSNFRISNSLISFYGWDILPAAFDFLHFETLNHFHSILYENKKTKTTLRLSRNGWNFKLHKSNFNNDQKYNLDEYQFFAEQYLFSTTTTRILTKINYSKTFFESGNSNLFKLESLDKVNVSSKLEKHFNQNFNINAEIAMITFTGYEPKVNILINGSLTNGFNQSIEFGAGYLTNYHDTYFATPELNYFSQNLKANLSFSKNELIKPETNYVIWAKYNRDSDQINLNTEIKYGMIKNYLKPSLNFSIDNNAKLNWYNDFDYRNTIELKFISYFKKIGLKLNAQYKVNNEKWFWAGISKSFSFFTGNRQSLDINYIYCDAGSSLKLNNFDNLILNYKLQQEFKNFPVLGDISHFIKDAKPAKSVK